MSRVYGGGTRAVRALDRVSLELRSADVVAVVGPSGSGKTTLLQVAGGIDHPTAGRVLHSGQDLGELTSHELTLLRRRHIGFVFQFFNLVPALSALDNVALPLRLDGIDRREARARGGATHARRARSTPRPRAGRAVGRRAATCRDRPRPGQRAPPDPGRRADRESDAAAGRDVVRLLVDAALERTSMVFLKDLPDAEGDRLVRAAGIFTIRRSSLREGIPAAVYLGPFAILLALAAGGALPARTLVLLALLPAALWLMRAGNHARTLHERVAVYQLVFLYVHVFSLVLMVSAIGTTAAAVAAGVLFAGRAAALALRLDPRLVEPDFTWTASARALARYARPRGGRHPEAPSRAP